MSHKKYKLCFFEKKQMRHEMKIQRKSHQLGKYEVNKIPYLVLMINNIHLMMGLKL